MTVYQNLAKCPWQKSASPWSRIFWHRKRVSSACGKLRFAAQRPRAVGDNERHSPFPLSTCPTAAETSLSLEVGIAQLGQAEEEEAMVKQLLGHREAFTLCWIQALSTVLCHGQFICGVAPARLFACDEIKKNASHESRYGGTDCEDNDLCISRNLVIGLNCTLLINSVVSLAKQIIMTVCLILDEVTRAFRLSTLA